MQIPLKPLNQPKRPPLELCGVQLYSTGIKKVLTNHFYKSMNHNFGVEISVRNNTSKMQNLRIGGCVYDEKGNTVTSWNGTKEIKALSSASYDFYVREETFSKMKEGKYKIQFWINDKKVQKEYFTITFK